MESRVVKLKSEFNYIINIRNIVKNVFDTLQIRIDRLRQIYAEFIKTSQSEMFIFGLDSFHFQSKLIDIEYDDMKRLFLAINNRMYCEYFKLNKIIVEYISKSVTDKKISELVKMHHFPVYKDLEPFREYKFEIILDIHENILNLLGILMSILNNKENELLIHKTKQNIGLNIDNFITSFNFNISVMREKIMMFITYIEFFHKMHSKYLKRFSNKIQLMYTHITNDIKFDDSVEISKDKKKELIDEFSTNNMDKTLLRELKTSIGSETNSEASDESNTKNNISLPVNNALERSHSSISIDMPILDKGINDEDINYKDIKDKDIKDKDIKDKDINDKDIINQVDDLNTIPLSVDKQKKDFKKIFQKNVHKVTGLLNLCKPKKEKPMDKKLTDKEIEDMFINIEESCDSIINEKPHHLQPESPLQNLLAQDNVQLDTIPFDKEQLNTEQITQLNITPLTIRSDEKDIIKITSINEAFSEQIDENAKVIEEEPIIQQNVTEEPIIDKSIQEETVNVKQNALNRYITVITKKK
jgi:hypothetical protein